MAAEGAAGSRQPSRVSADEMSGLGAEKDGPDTYPLPRTIRLGVPSSGLKMLPASYLKTLWAKAGLLNPKVCINDQSRYEDCLISALCLAQFSLLSFLGREVDAADTDTASIMNAEDDPPELDAIIDVDTRAEQLAAYYYVFYQEHCVHFEYDFLAPRFNARFHKIRGIGELFPLAFASKQITLSSIQQAYDRQRKQSVSEQDIYFFLQVRAMILNLDQNFYNEQQLRELRVSHFSVPLILKYEWNRYFEGLGVIQYDDQSLTVQSGLQVLRLSELSLPRDLANQQAVFRLDLEDCSPRKILERYIEVHFEQEVSKEIFEKILHYYSFRQYWRACQLMPVKPDEVSAQAGQDALLALLVYCSDPRNKVVPASMPGIVEIYQKNRFPEGESFDEADARTIIFWAQKFLSWRAVLMNDHARAILLATPVLVGSEIKRAGNSSLLKPALEKFSEILKRRLSQANGSASGSQAKIDLDEAFYLFLEDKTERLFSTTMDSCQPFWDLCTDFIAERMSAETAEEVDDHHLAVVGANMLVGLVQLPLISLIFSSELILKLREELAAQVSIERAPSVLPVSTFPVAAVAANAGMVSGSLASAPAVPR